MRVSINVGTRFPAYATSMGRVLLAALEPDAARRLPRPRRAPPAHAQDASPPPTRLRAELDRIRAQGWALVDQELEEGLRSVAAPIRDRDGRVVAAVNVSAHASRASARARPARPAPAPARHRRAHRGRSARTYHGTLMAQWSEHALERLSGAGYRRGGARQAVIELLDQQPCALTVLDIEDRLRGGDGRSVGRASIYRAVDELVTPGSADPRRRRRRRRPLRTAAFARPSPPPGLRRLRAPGALRGRRAGARDPRPRRARGASTSPTTTSRSTAAARTAATTDAV